MGVGHFAGLGVSGRLAEEADGDELAIAEFKNLAADRL